MIKVNIDAGNDLVMIAKDDIRMITSTPEGVWLYRKKSEEGILITSNNIEPAELFKKVAKAIACEHDEPESFRKKFTMEEVEQSRIQSPVKVYTPESEPCKQREDNNLTVETCSHPMLHDSEKPTIYRGVLNDEELISWMQSLIRDIERAKMEEECIPRLTKGIQDSKQILSETRERLSKSIKNFDRNRLIEPKGEIIWTATSKLPGNGSQDK